MEQTHNPKMKLYGTVVENHRGELFPDYYLKLLTEEDESVTVVYHSEFPPAINFHAGDAGYELSAGDQVEIYARRIQDKVLTTCLRNEYYIRKLPQNFES